MRVAAAFVLVAATWCATGPLRAATFTVITNADSGAGSLREALGLANGSPGPDEVTFAPALAGDTIALASPLPNIHEPVEIDADFGADCVPDVNVSGAAAGAASNGLTFASGSEGSRVHGLAWHGWSRAAIRVFPSDGVVVDCNHFGTDTAGVAVLPNGSASGPGASENGSVDLTGSNHTVGPGNLIVSSRGPGIRITDGVNSTAYPNFTALVSNSAPRVYATIDFADNCGSFSGGGFTPIDGSGVPFTENFGMRLRGRLSLGAAGDYTFDFDGLDDQATLRIDGNVIGSLLGGMSAPLVANLGSGAHTIEIDFMEGLGAARLATAITGPGSIALSSDDQALCAVGLPGLCAELFQLRVPSEGNTLTRNRMRGNAGPGIRLGFNGCGLLSNDAGDTDAGPNTLLNSPLITGFDDLGGGDFTISGTAPPNSIVELFLAVPTASGFGEGETFLADATATSAGNFVVVAPLPAQGVLTATATDTAGNTSQFGRNFAFTIGASGLHAHAQSTNSIALTWIDPDLGESGFRLERSTDGTAFSTVITLGNEATSHTDTGLAANTLYYYRVIATLASGDAPASNRATASTFPSSAAKVCYQRIPRSSGFVAASASDWDGSGWGVAWLERDLALDNTDLRFRRFDPALTPLSAVVAISDVDSNLGGGPFLRWNGTHYGVFWAESVRGAAGSHSDPPWFFARLDAGGQKVGGNVRIPLPPGLGNQFSVTQPQWDGSHWGLFFLRTDDDPLGSAVDNDVWFLRLQADGSAAGAPVAVTSTPSLEEFEVSAAWSPQRGHYGLSYKRGKDLDWAWVFQRVSASGMPIDANPVQLDADTFVEGQSGSAGGQSLLWDGANWALGYARDDPTSEVETAVWLRRIDGATGLPLGAGPARLSDDTTDGDLMLHLLSTPGGGYAAFTRTPAAPSFQMEVARMQADAAGVRTGARSFITPNDGHAALNPNVSGNGSEFLVLHQGNTNPALPAELYAVRVAADGASPPTAPVAITNGHDPNGSSVPTPIAAATLGAGFAALWTDGAPALPQLRLRIWDGAGQVVASLSPLSLTQVRGAAADMVGVGNSVAVAWKTPGNNVMFARYNASGGPITGEKILATAVGGQGNLVLRWNGEHYGLFYHAAGGSRYQRVDEAGNAVGSPVVLPRGVDNTADVEWLGDGWAFASRGGAPGGLDYLRLAADGSLLAGPVALTASMAPFRRPARQQLHYNGRELALSFGDWRGLDPPFEDIFFALLNRDGSYALPPFVAIGTQFAESSSSLHAIGSDFRLVPNAYGHSSGLAEFAITPAGSISPTPRFLSNRNIAVNRQLHVHNGQTLGTFYFPGGQQHLYFQTDACLADATPPPCPSLSAVQAGSTVQTSWGAVVDAESGVIRYLLYRDGTPLAETDADVLSYVDGFDASAPNVYQVRALNGAFVESASCPTVALSPLIFRDGFESPP